MNKEYRIILTLLGLSPKEVVTVSDELENLAGLKTLENIQNLVEESKRVQFDEQLSKSLTIGNVSEVLKDYNLTYEQFLTAKSQGYQSVIEEFISSFMKNLSPSKRSEISSKMTEIFSS